MSNPILATTNSKLDTRVKEPSGVVPPSSGSTPDRFKCFKNCGLFLSPINKVKKLLLE